MSTKATLKCGNNYHFYEDINYEAGEVFLEIENPPFIEVYTRDSKGTVGGKGVTIVTMQIPKEIWNEIIKIGPRGKTIAG